MTAPEHGRPALVLFLFACTRTEEYDDMATQPDAAPDTIAPQSPTEAPIPDGPAETPDTDLPGIEPAAPDYDQPDTAPSETPPPRE